MSALHRHGGYYAEELQLQSDDMDGIARLNRWQRADFICACLIIAGVCAALVSFS